MNLDPNTHARLNSRLTPTDYRRCELARVFASRDPLVAWPALSDGARATIREILGGRPVRDAEVERAWSEVAGAEA